MDNIDPKVSKYFSDLARKRKDNKRGFSDPKVVQRAIEKRRQNQAAKKNDPAETSKES